MVSFMHVLSELHACQSVETTALAKLYAQAHMRVNMLPSQSLLCKLERPQHLRQDGGRYNSQVAQHATKKRKAPPCGSQPRNKQQATQTKLHP